MTFQSDIYTDPTTTSAALKYSLADFRILTDERDKLQSVDVDIFLDF